VIVPRSKLLWWVALGLLPLSLLAAFVPGVTGLVTILFLAALLMFLVDAMLAGRSLENLAVELPPLLRFSKDRPANLELRFRGPGPKDRPLRLALALPETIVAEYEEQTVLLPGNNLWARASWPCRPLRRGRFLLRSAHVEGPSPLGFWGARGVLPLQTEIRVYPNLLRERNRLASLFLNRGVFGLHARRQVGKGREFEKLREYLPGDGYEDIHWKATARRARPITKVFQIEKTQEIYVILDASRLSARVAEHARPAANESPETALERFVTAALVLGLAAERQGDLFGLLAFTDRVEAFVRAKNGRAHYQACRDALYTLQPREVTPDFDEVAAFIRLRLRRRALFFFLTALDDPVLAESFVRNLDMLRRQHLILVNLLKPPFADPIFSDGQVSTVDDIYARLGGHLRWHSLRELEKVLQRRGVRLSLLDNEKLAADMVSQYLEIKRRQAL